MEYLYLHGFASCPQSYKAQFLRDRFAQLGLTLHIPDLNLGNFTEITLTKQLHYLQAEYGDHPLTVIGSSLGGFLAVQMAATNPLVEKIILLAPAFEFSRIRAKNLGAEAMCQWQETGTYDFYHYGFKQTMPLKYDFWLDAQTYDERSLVRDLPIAIVHGLQDEVIPYSFSQTFGRDRPNVTLELVDDDHSLGKVLELIWQKTQAFLSLQDRQTI
jgi:uncharacterized protein